MMLKKFITSRFFSSKISTIEEAVSQIKPGSFLLSGGFGVCGVPNSVIEEICNQKIGDLTVASNNAGVEDYGTGLLLNLGQVKKFVASYVGENKNFENQYLGGQQEFEITPQGTLAERIRCGGAGIPAFWTPTGANTLVQSGGFAMKYKLGNTTKVEKLSKPKPTSSWNNRQYIQEEAIFGDVAIIKAYKADKSGNLQYRYAARNFNENMATAAKYCIAEVEHIVEDGEQDPNHIHTPGIFIDKIVQTKTKEKRIEQLKLDDGNERQTQGRGGEVRVKIAKRVAKELKAGSFVNQGIGIPTQVPSYVDPNTDIMYQSENGILGVTGYPKPGNEDADLINAGKETVKIGPNASFFSSADSFGIVRGGHLTCTILGAMQVSSSKDIANWIIPGKLVKGMGGAMDLVSSGSQVIVAMEHTNRGNHKILDQCSLPLTGKGVVTTIVTEMAVFKWIHGVFMLVEIGEGYTLDQVKEATGCSFSVADPLPTF